MRLDDAMLYEDADLAVIDKPAGLAVHAGNGDGGRQTVADWWRDMTIDDDDPERPGIVHRLDKDTSGVLLLAKTAEAKQALQRQFKDRTIKKVYVAMVVGHPKRDRAKLDLPIGRDRKNPLKRAVVPRGKPSMTEYRVLERHPGYSLVELYPTTGRTHQLRVHMAYLGHPIAGDGLYGKPIKNLDRQWLHAGRLTFLDMGGTSRTVQAPLPKDLSEFEESLS